LHGDQDKPAQRAVRAPRNVDRLNEKARPDAAASGRARLCRSAADAYCTVTCLLVVLLAPSLSVTVKVTVYVPALR
jgi:hypothetical protein